MKCVEIVATTGFEGLRVAERPTPKPGPRQVLVRMHAASFNWRDMMILKGGYVRGVSLPRIPLSDGAGEIVECGAEVKRVKLGDRVCSTFFQTWITGPVFAEAQDAALGGTAEGVLSEYVVLEGEGVTKFPEHLSYEEAATLPCAALTAWHGLFEATNLRAGDTALLLGTGGVSVFGMQLARAAERAVELVHCRTGKGPAPGSSSTWPVSKRDRLYALMRSGGVPVATKVANAAPEAGMALNPP